ncbi:oxidoreductase [Symbiopectobacterium purcellii]|uniref:SDR family NAD(P)-dependent oxidoreductase n=1 Tax=Symbiopectobacterium purcellii TaxID=2871826 RepID=A0ABX9AIL5_9ENTR|nr:oxidoreductase [Symbiopectobacterium purcellii]QZN95014.1 SDR family NAD(P)-dependent oxidoreductase [Symbiopectobacterium purcellii]
MSTPSKGFTEADVPDQTGKCIIVTGANTGIGFEVARVLTSRGARVLLACRDKAKANEAIARIKHDIPSADLAFLPLDLADLSSIQTAAQLAGDEPKIDVLINNAGVMTPPLMRTKQGFELQFGVNHLGCFALTAHLLPKLRETAGARIVTTSSIAHRNADIDWNDINAENSYARMKRYSASKLANALFFYELDRRLQAINDTVISVGCHPGMAATELGRYMGPLQILNPLVKCILNSAQKGAWPTLQAATATVQPGDYYGPIGFGGVRGCSGKALISAKAQDPALARRLWDLSIRLTGVDPQLAPVQ